jgi:transcriptional regulator of acetoin/glycerol metabolism
MPTPASIVGAAREPWPLPRAERVDELIARSRQRSLHLHRLDPAQGGPRVLSAGALREHRDPLAPLLDVARSGMESLYLQIRDVGYVVLLTDADGVAVEFINNPVVDREARRAGLAAGGCWTEDHEGTCAVGMALVDQLPLTVHHDEHFRAVNRRLTCSAAPIFAADGRLVAVLDASALESPADRRSQRLVLSMVHQTARMIENAYFLRQFDHHLVLRTSGRREFLEVTTEGLIALDAEGRIVAVNQRFCHDSGRSANMLDGKKVEDLFGIRYDALVAAARRESIEPVKLRLLDSGGQCFAMLRGPRRSNAAAGRADAASLSLPPVVDALDALAGLDRTMQAAVHKVRHVIDKPVAVLLQGESGTGKEVFARAMHAASYRAAAAFVAVNCAAIPDTLIESELFGHSAGAFTGARSTGARGRITQASGGTLFLDEIGDMPLALQTRLLRVLAEGEVTPLGAEKALQVDLHVVCATHCNLDALVADGRFRLDLYYRLNGLVLTLPPLRERRDLESLIDTLLAEEAARCAVPQASLSARARALLLGYSWPGNIRQLKNALRAALLLCDGGPIEADHLPAEVVAALRPQLPPQRLVSNGWREAGASTDADTLRQVLQEHHWNISDTARRLCVSRSTVYRRMAKLRIVEPNRRD